MNPQDLDICACVRHESVAMHIVSCRAKHTTTFHLSTLDHESGEYASVTDVLRNGPVTNKPLKQAMVRAFSQLAELAMRDEIHLSELEHYVFPLPVARMELIGDVPAHHAPMDGQEVLEF